MASHRFRSYTVRCGPGSMLVSGSSAR
jgi:hypothetical protein